MEKKWVNRQYWKFAFLGVLALAFFQCNTELLPSAEQIINESIKKHDPSGQWPKANLNFHIQEPRISNPHRYSILKLNNANQYFEMSRNRDEHISKHIIEENGNSYVLFNGEINRDSALIKKYRLDVARNTIYRNFYYFMYGLPMSLESGIEKIGKSGTTIFNHRECYSIEVALKEEMFSKYWRIYIAKKDHQFLGMDIYFPEDKEKGERLIFDGQVATNGLSIPRIRHWYELKDQSYLGSDIVVQAIEE